MRILFLDGTKGFSPTRLSERAAGGIITSLTVIPQFLATSGHTVTVMSLHETALVHAGVTYLPISTDAAGLPGQDVVVFNRNSMSRPVAAYFRSQGAKLVWWLHDVVQLSYLQDDAFKLMDQVIALSFYCRDSYGSFYGIPHDKFSVISNAVDKAVFHPAGLVPRKTATFVTASAPIKGLHPLAFAWQNVRRLSPGAELLVYSSQKLHDFEDSAEQHRQLGALEELGATILDPIPQRELAQVFRESTALLMPNHYPEICSNLLLQAQACGLPVVASGIGSAHEFILHEVTGLTTGSQPHDMDLWKKEFAELTARILTDEALRAHISHESPKRIPGWDDIGSAWDAMLYKVTGKALVEAA